MYYAGLKSVHTSSVNLAKYTWCNNIMWPLLCKIEAKFHQSWGFYCCIIENEKQCKWEQSKQVELLVTTLRIPRHSSVFRKKALLTLVHKALLLLIISISCALSSSVSATEHETAWILDYSRSQKLIIWSPKIQLFRYIQLQKKLCIYCILHAICISNTTSLNWVYL